MRRTALNYLIVFVVSLQMIPSASATWGTSFRNLGKDATIGEPDCVSVATQDVVCVAQNQQHTLMTNEFKSNAWSGWTALAGVVTSNPSCANDGTGKIVCGVRSASNTLEVTVFDGTTWSAYVDSKGQAYGAPNCALFRNGKVFCTTRNLTSIMTGSLFDTTTSKWGPFRTTATTTTLTSDASCAGDSDGDVICAANGLVNNVNAVVVNRFDGSKWEGYLSLGGGLSSGPICTALGVKGQVMCFVRGTNTAIYRNMFKSGIWQNSNWTGWGGITGGGSGSKIDCAMTSAGALACGVYSFGDSFLYTGTYNGTSFSGFAKVGTKPILAGPACATLGGGKVICTVVGINNQAGSVTGP